MNLNFLKNKKFMKILKIIGNILMVISIIFIILYFVNSDIDFTVFLNWDILAITLGMGLVVSSGIILLALAWRKNLQMFTQKHLGIQEILVLYTRSNLARYIPGNVMHIASRNILGSEYELSQKNMVVSSGLEILLQILVTLALIFIMVADTLENTIRKAVEDGMIRYEFLILIAVGICAIVVAAIFFLIKRKNTITLRPAKMLISAGYYAGFCLINAFAFVMLIAVYEHGLSGYNILSLGGYYLLAWLLGLITPGAPGGLGIREYVLLMLFTPIFPRNDMLVIIVIMRVITVLGDIFAYLVGLIIKSRMRKKDMSYE